MAPSLGLHRAEARALSNDRSGQSSEQGLGSLVNVPLLDLVAQYQTIIDGVNANLANFETIKRFHLVPEEWALDSGELTPSLKLKRRVVNQKYEKEIATFYSDEASSHR